jgi:hypothetical protein
MAFDVLDWEDLPFPRSLLEFQRLFPDDTACARYLEQARWRGGFICPRCAVADGPRYISTHTAVAERGDPAVAEEYLPIIHLVFSNLKTWLRGTHHGVSPQHLQSYLNEFVFRFNRRFYPFNAFRSLLGIAGDVTAPTYAECYSTKSRTTTSSGRV